jgi:hypothetical protein
MMFDSKEHREIYIKTEVLMSRQMNTEHWIALYFPIIMYLKQYCYVSMENDV